MLTSWGQYPKIKHRDTIPLNWRDDVIDFNQPGPFLAYGQGRSYGDSCLNEDGVLITTSWLNRFINFNAEKGLLTCEGGATLHDILNHIVPRGWFLPVVPGTQFVSLAGAIANDVHGKNHHCAGTFGCYVQEFELLRSDGQRLRCSKQQNPELFAATIGGLGLTGIITWATIQLKAIHNAWLDCETIKFDSLNSFARLSEQSENDFEYTVAWIDCLARGRNFGRGVFMRANHNTEARTDTYKGKQISVPITPPNFVLNSLSTKLFNQFYYRKQKDAKSTQHYQPFFFPLDSIANWNRIYGKRGFLQYQCVVPNDSKQTAITQILDAISIARQGSFLSVLKTFGDLPSPGMLSFPQAGVTLALDFPNQGQKTLNLLNELDNIVLEHQGRVYPAKDARMSKDAFQCYYPNWQAFAEFIDPKFSSSFWRRVTDEA